VNTRHVAQEVDKLLGDMCLLHVVEWAYDPHRIISKRRLKMDIQHLCMKIGQKLRKCKMEVHRTPKEQHS